MQAAYLRRRMEEATIHWPRKHPHGEPSQSHHVYAGHEAANKDRVRNRVTPKGVWKLPVDQVFAVGR